MKLLITSFDPTATTSGSFKVPLPQNRAVGGLFGNVLLANESSVSLILTVNESRFRCPPWMLIKIPLVEITQIIYWQQEVILTNAASAPISLVLVDGWTPDEEIGTGYPIPLVRNTNVGGVVNTATVESLINDGNPPNTQVIETTPSDQVTSAFVLDNEGNLTLRTVNSGVWSIILQIVEGTMGGAASAVFHGTADVASSVAAANVAAGTLASGVHLSAINSDGGKITSDGSLGNLTVNALVATGSKNNGVGNYGLATTFAISTDNKQFATDGSGNIVTVGNILGVGGLSATTITLAGNGTFTRRGNFSGTGSGTVATGAGGTPTWIGITDNQSGSSATVGAVISGSNAVVTLGASHTWMGIAL
jgi:hypothetical protein